MSPCCLRRVLKCLKAWENGYILAQFRQHNRVTLANKGHRRVRTARQVLYPVELQTCGPTHAAFSFPSLSSASHCSPWVTIFSLDRWPLWQLPQITLDKNSSATLSTVLLKNGPSLMYGYLHACSLLLILNADILHIEKATYGQRRPPQWHVDSLINKADASIMRRRYRTRSGSLSALSRRGWAIGD